MTYEIWIKIKLLRGKMSNPLFYTKKKKPAWILDFYAAIKNVYFLRNMIKSYATLNSKWKKKRTITTTNCKYLKMCV